MRRSILSIVACLAFLAPPALPAATRADDRPSILFLIADDWSHPHAGAYGDPLARTPSFDCLAAEGVRFDRAYCMTPSCTASRGAILTGQASHRLLNGGNLWSVLPSQFITYPDRLEAAGYKVGLTGKGWGPGSLEGTTRDRNPAGPAFKSFAEFLQTVPEGTPFCYWFDSNNPHRPYTEGAGLKAGYDPAQVAVPPYWPDNPIVRSDVLDYYTEVEAFDNQVAEILAALEASGRASNTLVVMTSDNGMPFPRCKANLYDDGTRMPLAIRWPATVKPGAVCDDFVSFVDFAPTFLEAAGLAVPPETTGRSLLPLLLGQSQPHRDAVVVERERHANTRRGDLSYPARSIRTRDHSLILNLRPHRWPAGDPEKWVSVGPFGDVDGSPTKDFILDHASEPAVRDAFRLCFGMRPAVELYDLRADPDELHNVAGKPQYAQIQQELTDRLNTWRRQTADPVDETGDVPFDHYDYFGERPARQRPGN